MRRLARRSRVGGESRRPRRALSFSPLSRHFHFLSRLGFWGGERERREQQPHRTRHTRPLRTVSHLRGRSHARQRGGGRRVRSGITQDTRGTVRDARHTPHHAHAAHRQHSAQARRGPRQRLAQIRIRNVRRAKTTTAISFCVVCSSTHTSTESNTGGPVERSSYTCMYY